MDKTITPICNPDVYRLAAELIADGSQVYSCYAIDKALQIISGEKKEVAYSETKFYRVQYEAMFGWYDDSVRVVRDGLDFIQVKSDNTVSDHPFWCEMQTPERQQYRQNALLFMAAICENS